MNKIDLICDECSKVFEKPKNEYNRLLRNGRIKFFCTRSCAGKNSVEKNKKNLGKYYGKIASFSGSGKPKDSYSCFKPYLRRVKNRKIERGKEYDIDLPYLKKLWEDQNGKCALTFVDLVLEDGITNPNYSASLDRMNSSIGYMKGNLQFISVTSNYAKNKYTEEILQEFFQIIHSMPAPPIDKLSNIL